RLSPSRSSLLPCAITQKDGKDTPCPSPVGADARRSRSPKSGSAVPSSWIARVSRSTSSSRLACARCTSRSACRPFVEFITASSLVSASSLQDVQDRIMILDDYYTTLHSRASTIPSNEENHSRVEHATRTFR